MPVSVTLPALGESVTEGTVTRWLKQVGETVAADEPLLEVSTDKVDTEIPAPAAGVLLEIKVAEDETVEVGTELAVIGDEGEQPASSGSGAGTDETAGAADGRADQAGQQDGGAQQGQGGQQQQDDEARQAESQPDRTLEPEPAAEGGYGRPDPADEAPVPVATGSGGGQQAGSGGQPGQQPDGQPSSGSGGGGGARTPVLLPALGESVTEGTVTRWLKQVGETVAVDEPLLGVSTDKVDTEIPAPVAGVLLEVKVGEDETVEVGTELAVIGDESAAGGGGGDGDGGTPASAPAASSDTGGAVGAAGGGAPEGPGGSEGAVADAPVTDRPAQGDEEPPAQPDAEPLAQEVQQHAAAETQSAERTRGGGGPAPAEVDDTAPAAAPFQGAAPSLGGTPGAGAPAASGNGQAASPAGGGRSGDGSAYVTPLVRRLAAEHNVDLASLTGTGVGGRIRKQDVLAAAEAAKTPPAPEPQPTPAAQPAPAPASKPAAAPQQPSPLRGTTQKMNRRRQTIARRMVESLQVSAQLTTVVEVDVTAVAQLRQRAKGDFERREGVKLSFLPFFAKAALEALKVYPQLNATIDTERNEVTYFDAEHLGIAVDTEAGLVVPVIRDAGDLNIGGLARKIADVAERTRTNKIAPDELSGGTFTLTNTGSRGALFDTPIINQPQVGILGTGSVVKRPVVVPDAYGADSIAVRSMLYLALTYDHRLVDGADAARFLGLVKQRLEEGAFEADLGL